MKNNLHGNTRKRNVKRMRISDLWLNTKYIQEKFHRILSGGSNNVHNELDSLMLTYASIARVPFYRTLVMHTQHDSVEAILDGVTRIFASRVLDTNGYMNGYYKYTLSDYIFDVANATKLKFRDRMRFLHLTNQLLDVVIKWSTYKLMINSECDNYNELKHIIDQLSNVNNIDHHDSKELTLLAKFVAGTDFSKAAKVVK